MGIIWWIVHQLFPPTYTLSCWSSAERFPRDEPSRGCTRSDRFWVPLSRREREEKPTTSLLPETNYGLRSRPTGPGHLMHRSARSISSFNRNYNTDAWTTKAKVWKGNFYNILSKALNYGPTVKTVITKKITQIKKKLYNYFVCLVMDLKSLSCKLFG